MTRLSRNEYDPITTTLVDGYDYKNQAWVLDGIYQDCAHPRDMDCSCYGREHSGEPCAISVSNEAVGLK